MTKKLTRPHFIAIGAPHAGVGIVVKLLAAHPEVVNTIPSLQFFDTDAYEKKGVSWYVSQFAGGTGQLTGECSPLYLSRERTAGRIARHFPDTKLIVVLRHPIKRAIAHYEQWRTAPNAQRYRSCADFLDKHADAQLLGLYGRQLEVYFSYYSPLQIHVILEEEFSKEPLKVMSEAYRFLGIRDSFVPSLLQAYAPPPDEPRHKSLLYRLKKLIRTQYKKMTTPDPANVLLPDYRLSKYFSPEELESLTELYAKDAVRLSRLLHRDMGVFWELKSETKDFA